MIPLIGFALFGITGFIIGFVWPGILLPLGLHFSEGERSLAKQDEKTKAIMLAHYAWVERDSIGPIYPEGNWPGQIGLGLWTSQQLTSANRYTEWLHSPPVVFPTRREEARRNLKRITNWIEGKK